MQVDSQAPAAVTLIHRLSIAEAFEKGQGAFDVQMAPDGKGVVLYDRTVVEDDGPGACAGGTNWLVPRGKIGGKLMAKKVLHVERAASDSQQIVIWGGPLEGETAPLTVRVNGHKFTARPFAEEEGARELHLVDLRQRIIHEGDNEIVLSCEEAQRGWWVGMAQRDDILRNAPERADRPPRSFRSTDRGRTWVDRICANERTPGEFMVRLNLAQYAARGELIGPVIDLGELAWKKRAGLPAQIEVAAVAVSASKRLSKGTAIEVSVRSGPTPLHEEASWGPWRAVDEQGRVEGPLQRFVQWRAVLKTDQPRATPYLGNVELRAEVRADSPHWGSKVRVVSRENPEIELGASPRATLALYQSAQAWAAIQGRDFVLPDDVKELAPHVLSHRLMISSQAQLRGRRPEELITDIVTAVPVPVEA